ncbi:MAG: hypothetical protein HQL09_04855 [Nitrospirae bacterium]|nr:hypothetical protein [Nitrospirota bacterium]
MDRMNTTDRKTESSLSAEEARTLLAALEARERGEIDAPEPVKIKE